MTIDNILKSIDTVKVTGSVQTSVSAVTFDSRKAVEGCMFIAVRGTQSDGHHFIQNAVETGAKAVVCEKMPAETQSGVTYIKVKDSAHCLGKLASAFYGDPSRRFKLVGVTGTNGKTTTVTLLHQLFMQLGISSGCFTTIRNFICNKAADATHTTPDPVQLNRLMKDMADAGCKYVFMEVSSHALEQQRVAGLTFAGGIFSNITHDHLDYHKTFDAYLKAKKRFFDNMPADSFSLINADDRNSKIMVQNTKSEVRYYALKSLADFNCKIIESHLNGMQIKIDQTDVWTKFLGEFNAYNLLAVYACARMLGQDKEEILRVLSSLDTVEGRFQYRQSQQGVTAIIDYAHTPDAVKNVLNAITQIRNGDEQVITIIGAGGNRDTTKRPEMAKVAFSMSDKLILTSDNPRFEDPMAIINDLKTGLHKEDLNTVIVQPDRLEAIKTAFLLASKGDIILIAGKGHETYQEVNGVKHHFSDLETVESIISQSNDQNL